MVRTASMILSEWYNALLEQDCVKVMELLLEYPQLFKRGWTQDQKRVVEGRLSRSRWKGRTALHVGARRGCAQLVTQIVEMFDDEGRAALSNDITKVVDPLDMASSTTIFLGDLLAEKDGDYKLDALAMAVINGNRDIIRILSTASSSKCETNPYEISRARKAPVIGTTSFVDDSLARLRTTASFEDNSLARLRTTASFEDDSLGRIRKITEEVLKKISESSTEIDDSKILISFYSKSKDFNFLPWQVYLFHFTFTLTSIQDLRDCPRLDEARQNIFNTIEAQSRILLSFLCGLQDAQGRTALHVAVDHGTVHKFLSLVPQAMGFVENINAPDGVGRSPVHRAAAQRDTAALSCLIADPRTNLNERFYPWEYVESLRTDYGFDLENLSKRNNFNGFGWFDVYDNSSALHIAIIHKRRKCVELLLQDKHSDRKRALDLTREFTCLFETRRGDPRRYAFEPLQLSALVGDVSIVRLLLEDRRVRDPGRPFNWPTTLQLRNENPWPAFHLVAASGNFELLKLFMDSKHYDTRLTDLYGNTPLHHAARGKEIHFDTVLIDHISCRNAADSRLAAEGRHDVHKGDVERQGCIELLLQAGFEIWKTNWEKQAPYPGPDASAEVLSWWYKKLGQETTTAQNTLNAAANAIAVTGALVATASYVGPLQPPLGNNIEVSNLSVRMFLVCDTLSFYLAVSALMLTLMPALPMRDESMADELRRTERMVAAAVGLLFPSIICIILAFGAASVAVVPNNTSWNHGGLTMSTVAVGAIICFVVLFMFLVRLLTFYFHKNTLIRRVFKATAW